MKNQKRPAGKIKKRIFIGVGILFILFCCFIILKRFGDFSGTGYKVYGVSAESGNIYYSVRHKGLYQYNTAAKTSECVLSQFLMDGNAIVQNQKAVFYRGKNIYVKDLETEQIRKLYTVDRSQCTHFTMSVEEDDTLLLTCYHKNKAYWYQEAIDLNTGANITEEYSYLQKEPVSYGQSAETYFRLADRVLLFCPDDETLPVQQNDYQVYEVAGETRTGLLPEGMRSGSVPVVIDETHILLSYWEKDYDPEADSWQWMLLCADGTDYELPEEFTERTVLGISGGCILYADLEGNLMCYDLQKNEDYDLDRKLQIGAYGYSIYDDMFYEWAHWGDEIQVFRIRFDEEGRPKELLPEDAFSL